MPRLAHTPLLLGLLVGFMAFVSPASAKGPKELRGTWTGATETTPLSFTRKGSSYRAEVLHESESYRLKLRARDGRWEVQLARRTQVGASQRVGGKGPAAFRYRDAGAVALRWDTQGERALVGEGFRIAWPAKDEQQQSGEAPEAGEAGASGQAPGGASAPQLPKPVVKVLITGFDRFPKLRNHPRWVQVQLSERDRDRDYTFGDSEDAWSFDGSRSNPEVNPAGWAVRHFDPETLSPALLARAEVQVLRLNDLPVVYVDAAQAVIDAIGRIEPDVVISFGVGANGGADVDVERRCSNLMRDGYSYGDDQDRGPFQLTAAWPPAKPREQWSEAEREWLRRYPDNAGVSYSGVEIVPGAPETLTSTLPVDRIVAACRAAGLRPIDGGSGPGEYICNNVMYQVIRTQAARGKLGGFIHLRSWSEDKQDVFLNAVRCAIEGSVEEVLGQRIPTPSLGTGPR